MIVCLLALVFIGCSGADIPPPKNALKNPEDLRAAVNARLKGFESARFKEVTLEYFGKDQRVKVRQLILVSQPNKLRVQTRVPGTDEILYLLVTDGKTFAMHKRDTNEYITGKPTEKNINRLLPVNLSAADVVRVLLGGAPWDRFDKEGNKATLTWNRESGMYCYNVKKKDGGLLSMEIRHTDYAVVFVKEFNKKGKMVYAYEAKDWKRHKKGALPEYRRFQWPSEKLDFSLDVGETQVNVELPDLLFEFDAPEGSKVINLTD